MKKPGFVGVVSAVVIFSASAAQTVWAYNKMCDEPLTRSEESVPVKRTGEMSWDKASFRQAKKECQADAAAAKKRLKNEFRVNTSGMGDLAALKRLDEEVEKRRQAEARDARTRKEAADRRRAEEDRRHDKIYQDQKKQADKVLKQQNEALKKSGVKLDSHDASDSDIDAAELKMYQNMVDSGVAPKCRKKKGQALIDCVDAEVDPQ